MNKIMLLFLIVIISCSVKAVEKPKLDDIYYVDKKIRTYYSFWKILTPYILQFCDKDQNSKIIINRFPVGKYFSAPESQLQHINFGIGHLRYSLIHSIVTASGMSFKKNKNSDEAVRFVLMYNPNDMKVLEKAFKKIFSIELLSNKFKNNTDRKIPDPPAFYKKIDDTYFYAYNPKAIESAFLLIYIKPEHTLYGYAAQKLYDAIFRDYFKELSYITAILLSNPSYIQERSSEYLKLYQNDSKFHAVGYEWDCYNYIINSSKKNKLLVKFRKNYPEPYYSHHLELFSSRIMGILLRRNIDKTLPVVLKILRTILHDYDHETYNELMEYLYI